MSYAWLGLRRHDDRNQLIYSTCTPAAIRCTEQATVVLDNAPAALHLRMQLAPNASVQFAYSSNGQTYTAAAPPFSASKGRWVGAQMGLFSTGEQQSAGYLDVDYFRVTP
jgi:hypothetical protein